MNSCHNQNLRICDVEVIGASLPTAKSLTKRATKRTKLQLRWSKEPDIVKKAKFQKELRASVAKLKEDIAKYRGHYTKLRSEIGKASKVDEVQEMKQELATLDAKVRAAESAVKLAHTQKKEAESELKVVKKKQKVAAKVVKMGGERDLAQGVYMTLETQLKAAKDFNKTNNV